MTYNNITHVIFDMDGLLLDSERLYTEGFQNVVRPYGKEYTWDLKVQLMGKQAKEVAEMIIKALSLPLTPDEFNEEARKELVKLFPDTELMPGAERLIRHLHKNNIPVAVASSSAENNAKVKLQKHEELFGLFSHKIFGTSNPNIKNGKPAPDIFLYCASQFADHPEPENCLVFEDAPSGLQAGIAANMQVVMVPDPRLDKSMTRGATLVLSSLEDFKPELFGLPPFKE